MEREELAQEVWSEHHNNWIDRAEVVTTLHTARNERDELRKNDMPLALSLVEDVVREMRRHLNRIDNPLRREKS